MQRGLFCTFLILMILTSGLHAIQPSRRPVGAACLAGIAYPQIPLSQFRPPVGIAGSAGIQWRMTEKWAVYGAGSALKTFSLGTVTGRKATLKFDAEWVNFDLQYLVDNNFTRQSYISAGAGAYKLHRQLDHDIDRLTTPGLNLGFISYIEHMKGRSVLEIRWHLLFKPSDNPQILTITFGIFL